MHFCINLAEFKTGMPEMGSLCNWEFSSSIDLAGSIHTPDTYVHYNDTIKCEYSFFGKQEEVVELEIVMPVLRSVIPSIKFLMSFA